MKVLCTVLFSLACVLGARFENYPNDAPAFNVELAQHINALKTTWFANEKPYPIFQNMTHGEVKRFMGAKLGHPKIGQTPAYKTAVEALPDSFEAAQKWPSCPTIKEIRDQSACGSCWAFGAAESISDRLCIHLGGKYSNISISANDLMSCCSSCGYGCDGGYPEAAWRYYVNTGITTDECDPYPFPKCEHHIPKNHYPPCPDKIYNTPACPSRCQDGTPFKSATRYFGKSAWSLRGESQFQQELYENGPFEVTMNVYQDFEQYKGGIYKHVSGSLLGGHAIKVVGWGSEGGVKYWRIANSWNSDWGEDGYFRILRGVDECGIESGGTAGTPKSA